LQELSRVLAAIRNFLPNLLSGLCESDGGIILIRNLKEIKSNQGI
jgi:hypothetical protein